MQVTTGLPQAPVVTLVWHRAAESRRCWVWSLTTGLLCPSLATLPALMGDS